MFMSLQAPWISGSLHCVSTLLHPTLGSACTLVGESAASTEGWRSPHDAAVTYWDTEVWYSNKYWWVCFLEWCLSFEAVHQEQEM